jgi:hypothetical protein
LNFDRDVAQNVLASEKFIFKLGILPILILELDAIDSSEKGSRRDIASVVVLHGLAGEVSIDALTLDRKLRLGLSAALRILVGEKVD